MDYLLFRLYGPLASWGDMAVGESRHSHIAPTKSAIMGLVAAALGIQRDNEAIHQALNQHYSMAAAVWSKGQFLRDYHTVQTPKAAGKFRYRTRRDELTIGCNDLSTVLSAREYRTEALAWIALRQNDQAPFTWDECIQALHSPKFTLYLGRKSCPLAAPLAPAVIQAEGFYAAFQRYAPGPLWLAAPTPSDQLVLDERLNDQWPAQQASYYWEGEASDFAPPDILNTITPITFTWHDQLLSRQRWQFSPRHVQFWEGQ